MLKILNVRKKPVVVQAILVTEGNMTELADRYEDIWQIFDSTQICVNTMEGEYLPKPGNYIIIGVRGEIYPIDPDVFKETYDIVVVERPPLEYCSTCHDIVGHACIVCGRRTSDQGNECAV